MKMPSTKWRHVAWRLSICGAVGWAALGSPPAFAQSAAPTPTGAPDRLQTVLGQAAQAVGIRRCQAAVEQVAAPMFAQTKRVDIAVDWDHGDPDNEPFFTLSGLEYQDASAVMSLTTVPSATGGCSILVERISSAPMPCKEVARATLAGYRSTSLVRAVTIYVNPARLAETVTLIDSPASCMIIRRQTRFHWVTSR